MYRTNTARDVIASGLVHIDAGEGVTLTVPTDPAEGGGGVSADHPMLYDSDWWNITSLIPVAVTSGALWIRRTGMTVWLDFVTLQVAGLPAAGWHAWNALLPEGFRPPRTEYVALAPTLSRSAVAEGSEFATLNAPNWAMGPFRADANGRVIVYDAKDVELTKVFPIQGLLSFPVTSAPPTSVPGIPG